MTEPTFVMFDETERIDADSVPPAELERLEVGQTYRARGPAPDSKLGPPATIRVVAELEDGWRVEAVGKPAGTAPFVHRRAARHWRPVIA